MNGGERRIAFLQRVSVVAYWLAAPGLAVAIVGMYLRLNVVDVGAGRLAVFNALMYGGGAVWMLGMVCLVVCQLFIRIEALMTLLEAAFDWVGARFSGRKHKPKKKKKSKRE